LLRGRAWYTLTWTRSSGSPVKSPCSALVNLSHCLFKTLLIRGLLGSLKAATANWFDRLRLIARCSSSSTRARDACLANNRKRPWEPHKYASLELQNTMLSNLQEWVAGYYHREDAWSYQVHREIFDTFTGPKVEHRELDAYSG